MNQKGLATIIIVLLIALGIGGYLIYSGKISLNRNTSEPISKEADQSNGQVSAQLSALTINEMIDSIEYSIPPEWKETFRGNEYSKIDPTIILYSPNFRRNSEKGPDQGVEIIIGTWRLPDNTTLEEWIEVEFKPGELWGLLKPVKLARLDGFKMTNQYHESLFVLREGIIWHVNISYLDKDASVEHKNSVDSFIESIKFLDQNATSDISNWKIYTSPEHKFSFKYPSTWKLLKQSGTDNKSVYSTLSPPEQKSHLGDSVNVTAHYNPQQLSIEEFVRKTTPVNVNYETIVIGGIEGKEALDIPSAQGGRYIFVKNNPYIYEIHLNTDNLDFFKSTFDQILSTFKFE